MVEKYLREYRSGRGLPCEILRDLALRDAAGTALICLNDDGEEKSRLTRAGLQQKVDFLAKALRAEDLVGQRILLAFESSSDYVCAFLACLYSGAIAVPVYPPRSSKKAWALGHIWRDSGAALMLTSEHLKRLISQQMAGVLSGNDRVLSLDDLTALNRNHSEPGLNTGLRLDDVAYLQYTSGSTGQPKGVVITHRQLISNVDLMAYWGGVKGSGDCFLSWLPIYHDMGLISGILLPLLLGATAVLLPSAAFIKNPLNWLKAIDRYKAVFSAAPDFAYNFCVSQISSEAAQALNLSSWKLALNGAEPIWAQTLDLFCKKFECAGFRPEFICTGYGMAEATLAVSMKAPGCVAPRVWVDQKQLGDDRVVLVDKVAANAVCLVSCGQVGEESKIQIVNPLDFCLSALNAIGEIWVCSPSVGLGYWNNPEATQETFLNEMKGGGKELSSLKWLRTGDLGFVHEGQLYVTGRLKELVIVRGVNHYPQDLERTAFGVDAALRQGSGACVAFAVEGGAGVQQVVIVQEVERSQRYRLDVMALAHKVVDAIASEHGVAVDEVVFVPPATIPQTTSGKVQRRACRALWESGELKVLGRWQRPAVEQGDVVVSTLGRAAVAPQASAFNTNTQALGSGESSLSRDSDDVAAWLRAAVADALARDASQVDPHRPLMDLGLDSIKLVQLVTLASEKLNVKLSTTAVFDHPTIHALALHVQSLRAQAAQPAKRAELPQIAIVGMDCRFPGGHSLDAFWQLLMEGRDAIKPMPSERVSLLGGVCGTRAGGWLEGVDGFDAAFFGISPREAQSMDPQQRLWLETAWHALERAHISPDNLKGSATGVFAGVCNTDYYRAQRILGVKVDGHAGTGNAASIVANRLSYVLGLQGPSMAVDTACSSSLVAIHQACQSLMSGETSLAIAGGVNLILADDFTAAFDQAGMLSPDGHCKTFDAAANGYVRAEGCGVLVLKRLDDALRDGNPVLAVVRGSAVNQDGASNGLTAPKGSAQQQVMRAALKRAELEPADIDYVETHGTGTSLGDPIEVKALQGVLDTHPAIGAGAAQQRPCWLGAVKTQIGHLESAAGVAGVIKAVLALQHGVIPANQQFSALNPQINLEGSRLRPVRDSVAWLAQADRKRRCGVSSFGFGGTNAHVILEEAPPPVRLVEASPPQAPIEARLPLLYTLSAQTPAALRQLAEQHGQALGGEVDSTQAARIAALSYTARSTALPHRLALCAKNSTLLAQGLVAFADESALPSGLMHHTAHAQSRPALAFLFTGQGAHYVGMGRELFEAEPVFRRHLLQCDRVLQPLLEVALPELLFGSQGHRLNDTRYAQPALVALQLSLVALWAHHGVQPQWVCGHSVGEYAAAVTAGLFDSDTALRLVVARAACMADAPGRGAMLSVGADEDETLSALGSLGGELDVAACNSPRQTVLSGEVQRIDEALAHLKEQGFLAARLAVSHAFHSRLMLPVSAVFEPHLSGLTFKKPRVSMLSTGGTVDADMSLAAYWVDQIRQPVRFAEALQSLHERGIKHFIEIGPGSNLLALVRDTLSSSVRMPSLALGADAHVQWRASLGHWWAEGGHVDLRHTAYNPRSGAQVSLPVYPFEHRSHWFERPTAVLPASPASAAGSSSALVAQAALSKAVGFGPSPVAAASHPAESNTIVLRPLALASQALHVFETHLDAAGPAWLRDHVVASRPVMPAAAWIAMCIAAVRCSLPQSADQALILNNLRFDRPLDFSAASGGLTQSVRVGSVATTQPAQLQTVLARQDGGWQVRICLYEAATQKWTECASGDTDWAPLQQAAEPVVESGGLWECVETNRFYATWAQRGLAYGPAFQLLQRLEVQGDQARAMLRVPAEGGVDKSLHPAWLDAAFHTIGTMVDSDAKRLQSIPLPIKLARLQWMGAPPAVGLCHVRAWVRARFAETVTADLQITREDGTICLDIKGLELKWVEIEVAAAPTSSDLNAEPRPTPAARLPRAASAFVSQWHPARSCAGSRTATRRWLVVGEDAARVQFVVEAVEQGLGAAQGLQAHWDQPEALLAELRTHWAKDPAAGVLLAVSPCVQDNAEVVQQGITLCMQLQKLLLACDALGPPAQGTPLCLVTSQAATGPWGSLLDGRAAGAIAMWRSAAKELPRWLFQHADLAASLSGADAVAFVNGLAGDETEWRVHDAVVYARRLLPLAATMAIQAPSFNRIRASRVFKGDGAVLISGGTGALGLHMAHWLVQHGVRHLCLLSRHPQLSEHDRDRVETWRALGCRVEVLSADVSQKRDVEAVLSRLRGEGVTLRGVVHAAGALADVPLALMTQQQWTTAMQGKALGCAVLDELTSGLALDFWLGFSSCAAPLGSAGQCNYAAANGLMEATLQRRRNRLDITPTRQRSRVLTVQWGVWAEGGMVADGALLDHLERRGIRAMTPAEALAALDKALFGESNVLMIGHFDWPVMASAMRVSERPVSSLLRAMMDARAASLPTAKPLPAPARPTLASATPVVVSNPAAVAVADVANAPSPEKPSTVPTLSLAAAARPSLEELVSMNKAQSAIAIRQELALQLMQVLKLNRSALYADNPARFDQLRLSALGVDSLMAMEIRSRIREWLDIDLPAQLLIGGTQVGELMDVIRQKALLRCISQPTAQARGGGGSDAPALEVFVI